jgi:hypothetical protein
MLKQPQYARRLAVLSLYADYVVPYSSHTTNSHLLMKGTSKLHINTSVRSSRRWVAIRETCLLIKLSEITSIHCENHEEHANTTRDTATLLTVTSSGTCKFQYALNGHGLTDTHRHRKILQLRLSAYFSYSKDDDIAMNPRPGGKCLWLLPFRGNCRSQNLLACSSYISAKFCCRLCR